jgi:hypothetical protein
MKSKKEQLAEISKYLINPRCDYRKRLFNYKLSLRGDLLINRGNKWEVLIPCERLTDRGWLADMATENGVNYGEFCRAYFTALQRMEIQEIGVRVYNFDDSFKYADE